MKIFSESSFFKERRAPALPTPAEIRAISKESGNIRATSFNRPPPVKFPSLGLIVKYGADVTIVEAQTQMMAREKLLDVPIPEVFGWTKDEDQRFIYMSLIEGQTLLDCWGSLSEDDKQAICKELKHMVKAWRALEQGKNDYYIGSLGKQPLNEIILLDHPELTGPYQGSSADCALQQFQAACQIDITGKVPIVFTHNDLVPPNILIAPGQDSKVKVAAIIDWGQAGWYPAYWEYCKSRRVQLACFRGSIQEEWCTKYLPLILDRVDDETCYHPWLYFVLSKL